MGANLLFHPRLSISSESELGSPAPGYFPLPIPLVEPSQWNPGSYNLSIPPVSIAYIQNIQSPIIQLISTFTIFIAASLYSYEFNSPSLAFLSNHQEQWVFNIEVVLEFFRKKGLLEFESALTEDILKKSKLGFIDFQGFLLPMVLPQSTLKIPPILTNWEQSVDEVLSSRAIKYFSNLHSPWREPLIPMQFPTLGWSNRSWFIFISLYLNFPQWPLFPGLWFFHEIWWDDLINK